MKAKKNELNVNSDLTSKFNNCVRGKDEKKAEEQPQIFWDTCYKALQLASFNSFYMEREMW